MNLLLSYKYIDIHIYTMEAILKGINSDLWDKFASSFYYITCFLYFVAETKTELHDVNSSCKKKSAFYNFNFLYNSLLEILEGKKVSGNNQVWAGDKKSKVPYLVGFIGYTASHLV